MGKKSRHKKRGGSGIKLISIDSRKKAGREMDKVDGGKGKHFQRDAQRKGQLSQLELATPIK